MKHKKVTFKCNVKHGVVVKECWTLTWRNAFDSSLLHIGDLGPVIVDSECSVPPISLGACCRMRNRGL